MNNSHKLRIIFGIVLASFLLAATAYGTETPVPPSRETALANSPETITVPLVSAYLRADQPGLRLEIRLKSDSASRMRSRLNTLLSANLSKLGENAATGAEGVIKDFLSSTAENLSSLIQVVKAGDSPIGTVLEIPDEYMKSYDFVAIGDSRNRVILYPLAEYDVNLKDTFSREALPEIRSMLLATIKAEAKAAINNIQNAAEKLAMNEALDANAESFTLTIDHVRNLLSASETTQIAEGLSLSDALTISSDMIVGGLGGTEPLIVARGESTQYVGYALTVNADAGVLVGLKFNKLRLLSDIMAEPGLGPQIYLNEKLELVYIRGGQSWLSADADKLSAQIASRGGKPTGAEEPDEVVTSTPEVIESGTNRVIVIVSTILGAIIIVAAGTFVAMHYISMRRRAPKRDDGSSKDKSNDG
jgi:hypothetical protein